MIIDIQVTRDTVEIERQVIERPPHISVSQWLSFWEDTIDYHDGTFTNKEDFQ